MLAPGAMAFTSPFSLDAYSSWCPTDFGHTQINQPFDGKRDYQDQPLNIPLCICGETYSDAQGWVECALQTADLVLATFGVEPPTALRTARTRAAKA
jgi:hypothetical protein